MRASNLEQQALGEVRAVYRALADRPVERQCVRSTGCCQFRLTGRTPQLTSGEARLLARAVRAGGRRELPGRDDGACPLLRGDGTCLVYEARPFGCRTHFCAAAGGVLPRASVLDLIRRLEAVDGRLGGCGPRPLAAAVESELAKLC